MRVCIFGAGAIGGVVAGLLARHKGVEVSVVARGRTLSAIQSHGLRVSTATEEFTVRVNAASDARELPRQDFVFVTLKGHQLVEALPQIEALMDKDTVVIPPTTGIPHYFFYDAENPERSRRLASIDPDGKLWATLPPKQVLGAVYWFGAHAEGPGVVRLEGEKGGVPIGELDGRSSARVMALNEALSAAGIHAPVKQNIRGDIWVKFVNSLCWNAVAILTMAKNGDLGSDPTIAGLLQELMTEADSVASALGVVVPYPPEKRIKLTLGAPEHKMSMLQDLEMGRPLEFDYLYRSFYAVRDLAAIATPTVDMVLALARARSKHSSVLAPPVVASNGSDRKTI